MNADILSRRMERSRMFWAQKLDERSQASARAFHRTTGAMTLITLLPLTVLALIGMASR